VTLGRAQLFKDWEAGSAMSRILSDPAAWSGSELLCWVLMPDHWHGLVKLGGARSLAETMNRAKGLSARRFNQANRRHGPVWANAFHDHALRKDENLRGVARYIFENPVRAGLVKTCGNYPFWDACWLGEYGDLL